MAFRRLAQNLHSLALLVSLFALAPGCSAVVMDNDSPPEAQYAEGERLLGKDRYLEAVERFRILKSRYPYSKYAALASLRIGDAHFKEEAFLEAASAYKIFRDLYPRHEEAAYALYRIAESHYNMLPSTTDRDLEPAQEAIAAYQRLLQDYPGAPQAKEAESRVKELRGKLAEREAYVGNFYFQRELYQASASRYSFLLDNYPEAQQKDECLYRLAFSLERMGEYRKAETALEALNADFPNGREEGRRLSLRDKVQAGLSSAQ